MPLSESFPALDADYHGKTLDPTMMSIVLKNIKNYLIKGLIIYCNSDYIKILSFYISI